MKNQENIENIENLISCSFFAIMGATLLIIGILANFGITFNL